jgi:hypothetical protein
MPKALADRGGDVEIQYVSPLNRSQRAEEGVAILRTLEAIAPIAQLDPSVMMRFNPDAIVKELAEINGVPAKILRSDEEIAEMRQQQAQQAEAQALLQAAPIAANSAKTLAETAALSGQQPAALPI